MNEHSSGFDIAIIGMAGKFPGANNINDFWQNLCESVESITYFSDEELLQSGVDPSLIADPNYVKSRCIITDEDKFDAFFFDFSPREVEIMDPQQRLFLETAWTALENAGYVSNDYKGMIGLFGGVSINTYLFSFLTSQKSMISSAEGYQLAISNDKDFLTTRISYKLNLTGPSVVVQTACSTSLVATHIACQNLLNYSCDIALAGGVSINIPQKTGYYYQEGMILSKDGHCRAFDEQASGTISGNGVGIVVLKRLEEALADGDHIYAVIKGSSYNNDGSFRVGYTAPSVEGQSEVIANALAMAGVHPESISYIEAHGTGTELGDPIEIAALTQVFREQTDKKGFCAVGSVKTNIGHLDAAAGVVGLMKTALALKYKKIPASLNFEKPNLQIDFENSPFFVNSKLRNWETNGGPRRAGVSSFGIGGTNAHVVLEEAPVLNHEDSKREYQLLLLSAKTQSALEEQTENLIKFLQNQQGLMLADIAYTLQVGRKPFNYRRMLVSNSLQDGITTLENRDPKRVFGFSIPNDSFSPPVAFMFSGQGAQYVNMGFDLYQTEPCFREHIDKCCQLLLPHLGFDLKSVLYPGTSDIEDSAKQLNQTYITQPALFVVEYALAKQLMDWDIKPQVMVGHSIGEYVAACLANVFSLNDALRLVTTRGKLMQSMPSGVMISVPLNEIEIQQFLTEDVSIAAINSKENTVLSGSFEAITALEKNLDEKSIQYRKLFTSHAFHSETMDPILDKFVDAFEGINLQPPKIPYFSNITGTWITDSQATDPNYYAKHLRYTVRFSDNVSKLLENKDQILLEVGPGKTLTSLASRNSNFTIGRLILSTIRHPQEKRSDSEFILNTLGRLWLNGVTLNWQKFHSTEKRLRVPLPTYPFERSHFWIKGNTQAIESASAQRSLRKKADISTWFYTPSWKRQECPLNSHDVESKNLKWLIFNDDYEIGSRLVEKLKNRGEEVVAIKIGENYNRIAENEYCLNPHNNLHYDNLLESLAKTEKFPDKIVHLWNFTSAVDMHTFEEYQKRGFESLIYITQGIAKHNITTPVQINVISSNLFSVSGDEMLQPEKSTLLGPSKVISQEYPNLQVKNVDFCFSENGIKNSNQVINKIFDELHSVNDHTEIAYRGKFRWIQTYQELPMEHDIRSDSMIRKNGVYLISGGLGRIGLLLTEFLIKNYQANLILIDRPGFPARSEWQDWLNQKESKDSISIKISKLMELEKTGSDIQIFTSDISNQEKVTQVVNRTIEHFGEINGVIHAAGLVGKHSFQTISELTPEDVESQFLPKINGILNLKKALQHQNLDFCILQSSMSTILGGLGFAAYSASNYFLDLFAQKQFVQEEKPWISINWDGWNFEEQMTTNSGLGSDQKELTLSPHEGLEAFKLIFSKKGLSQLLVSTGDLDLRIEKWLKLQSREEICAEEQQAVSSLHERPNLQTTFVAPQTEIEKEIVEVFQKILGIESIGIYDDFFDLGGNSLIGTQLVSKLRDTFKVEFPLRSLFEDPTVAAVAKIIDEQKQDQAEGVDKISEIFQKLEQMSDDEAKTLAEEKKTGKRD